MCLLESLFSFFHACHSLKEKLKTKMIFSLPRVSVNISVSIGAVTDHELLSIIHEYLHIPQLNIT